MRKVFWENTYQRQLYTTVKLAHGNTVALNETIAFSFSGGQESDRATINQIPVQDSRIEGKIIYYVMPENHGLTEGQEVLLEIDWQRRYRLMRLHFAAELILEIVTQKLGIEKIGAHISENKSRIDFVLDRPITPYFDEILKKYNEIIDADHRIETGYTDIENQRRYWKIEGFAQVPCGGTHVKSTKEVGYVTLKRKNIGGGKERIEIMLKDDFIAEPSPITTVQHELSA